MPAAFKAAYCDWKLVRTRQVVQIVFEVPLSEAGIAYDVLGGMPNPASETWFGIAPLHPPAATEAAADPERLEQPAPEEAPPQPETAKVAAKRAWEDLQPAQQAGIRSHDIRFEQFLEEEYKQHWRAHKDSAECIRSICGVNSRSQIGVNRTALARWQKLDQHFQAWDAKVRLNA